MHTTLTYKTGNQYSVDLKDNGYSKITHLKQTIMINLTEVAGSNLRSTTVMTLREAEALAHKILTAVAESREGK